MGSQLRPLSLLTVLVAGGIALLATPRFVLGQEATFVQKTFTYKVVGDTEIQADVYRADDDLARPVLVWIHGGALMMGTRRNPPQRLVDLCRIAGFVLVSIDYRLAPTVTLPAIIEDLEDAFAWIRHEGPRLFGADPAKLAVAGASAGGYLTMASGIRVKPRPTALVAYYGYGSLDSPWYTEPSEHYRTSVPLVTEEEAYSPGGPLYLYFRQNGLWTKVVTGFDPTTQREELDPYTPVRNITPEYPPIMMLHGTLDTDVPYEESVAMAEQLTSHRVQHELILLPGGGHGLGGADPKLVTDAHNRALAFIHRHLTGEAQATEIVPLLDALALLDAGENLAMQGDIAEAIEAYAEAQRLEPEMTVPLAALGYLCWYGAVWGLAEEVMTTCEEAVARGPNTRWIRGSRGIARALAGDTEGAVADLEAWVAGVGNESQRLEIQGWIDALQTGKNPFTPEVLEELRKR